MNRGQVEQIISFKTKGRGINSLKAYYAMLGNELSYKLPGNAKDWVAGSQYDAPHGFLFILEKGRWMTTFSLNSVVADIQSLPGVAVQVEV